MAYTSGNYQGDVVEPVKESKIVKSERDIHAYFCVGLLILGCALTKRLADFRPAKGGHKDALMVDDSRLWKLISIIQSGEIQLDMSLAERCLSPLRVSSGKEPTRCYILQSPRDCSMELDGVVFPIEDAVNVLTSIALRLYVEYISQRKDAKHTDYNSKDFRIFVDAIGRGLGHSVDTLRRVGVIQLLEMELDGKSFSRLKLSEFFRQCDLAQPLRSVWRLDFDKQHRLLPDDFGWYSLHRADKDWIQEIFQILVNRLPER